MTQKCSSDDPCRCKGTTKDGQCRYLSVEGSEYCNYHNGADRGGRRFKEEKRERYLIDNQQLRESYLRQRDDTHYLDLKDEILLVQAVLERRLNSIKNEADMQMAVGHVTQLVKQLESMKLNLMKIQQQLGLVLGKDELRVLARNIAGILDEELDGIEDKEDRIERICERMILEIESAGQKDTE